MHFQFIINRGVRCPQNWRGGTLGQNFRVSPTSWKIRRGLGRNPRNQRNFAILMLFWPKKTAVRGSKATFTAFYCIRKYFYLIISKNKVGTSKGRGGEARPKVAYRERTRLLQKIQCRVVSQGGSVWSRGAFFSSNDTIRERREHDHDASFASSSASPEEKTGSSREDRII